ncbi:MAG: hypothetical protein SAK29_26085 [Scytonema sp. PMC 1069.18]|nr:hypothetical protein [Scytonema sp. PMC 1069.18]MEC4887015.1 hypothetical protein [Scytonema sp. PMC 1070.18]
MECPICGTKYYQQEQSFCENCGWSLLAQNSGWLEQKNKKDEYKALKNDEDWAKDYWKKIRIQQEEINRLKKQLDEKADEYAKQTVERLNKWEEEREKTLRELLSPLSELSALRELVESIKQIPQTSPVSGYTKPFSKDNLESTEIKNEIGEENDKEALSSEEVIDLDFISSQHTQSEPAAKNSYEAFTELATSSWQVPQERQEISLTTEEQELISSYNRRTISFENIDKISLTQESIEQERLGSNKSKLFFEPDSRGFYRIVPRAQEKYLVPDYRLKINQFNYESLETSFNCSGNWQEEGCKLKLVKPGRVKASIEGNKWELEEKGVIEFT